VGADAAWQPYIRRLGRLRDTVLARHVRLRVLPPHLLATLEAYLPPHDPVELAAQLLPLDALSGAALPCALHGDVTAANVRVLLREHLPAAHWREHGSDDAGVVLCDFADALTGDPLFELLPVALAVLALDGAALAAFVAAYHLSRAAAARAVSPAAAARPGEAPACAQDNVSLPAAWPLASPRDRRRATWLALLHPVNAVAAAEACPRVMAAGGLAACPTWAHVEALLWG
jgi:hypothetical protein